MAANTRKPNASPPVKLSTLFSRKMAGESPEIAALWTRHFNGDVAADHALFVHYAPLVQIVAKALKRKNPELFNMPLEEMQSDGALGLLNAIRLTAYGHPGVRGYMRLKIRGRIYSEMTARRFGGEWGHKENRIISEERGRLVADLGRLPTVCELAEKLRGKITNANIVIHGERDIYAASQLFKEKGRLPDVKTFDPPDAAMIDADTLRIASKGMDATDRKILKLLLKGMEAAEIGRTIKLSPGQLHTRFNGVLWQCRANAKLADYLGIDAEPIDMPSKHGRQGRYPSFGKYLDRAAG